MTDKQIINEFEKISKDNHMSLINQMICSDTLELINRQKAEIEELHSDKIIAETHERAARDLFVNCTQQLNEANAENERLLQKLQQLKSEAIKEFAERLKKYFKKFSGAYWQFKGEPKHIPDDIILDIDNLVKEMTERKM